ncbi:MAG: heat-shock protein Hsp20 [Bacteroidetes bacterium B1(2017)]|nr:MAG: heat-shock protein Hsp20 [Bacteroidetes bacterium B1(2017)]
MNSRYPTKNKGKNNMTLIKFNPAKEFFRERMMPSEINSLFDSFFNEGLGKFERNVFFTPRADVIEKEENFEVHLALPGLKKDEISIDIEKNVLSISGERKLKNENKEDKYHMVENFYGKFSRKFTLPENIDQTKIDAQFTDGILTVVLPKQELKQNTTKVVIK